MSSLARRGRREVLRSSSRRDLKHDGSVDGILCWDLFDFLDRATGQALATPSARCKPGGVFYGFFGATAGPI